MKKIFTVIVLLFSQISFALGNPSYEIIDMEVSNNLPFIRLKLENEEVKFMLDTGARNQVLVLEKDIIAKLTSLIPFSVMERSTDITGKMFTVKKYILPKFNIGDISFVQLRVVEDSNWGLKSGGSIDKDGVIGLELFLEKGIILDYPNRKLVIIDRKMPEEYDCDNWHNLQFKVDRDGVSIFANIDGKGEKRFILDTGSTISLIKPTSIGNNIPSNHCNISLTQDGKCSFIKPSNISISNIDVVENMFYIYNFQAEFEPDGILGYDFIANKVIYIDFAKRVIKLKP